MFVAFLSITYTIVMKSKNNYNIGDRIYQFRRKSGLSQEQLAFMSGITPTYLGLIERSKKNCTVRILEQICNALDITLSEFFSNEEPTPKESLDYQFQLQLSSLEPDEQLELLKLVKDIIKFKKM